MISDIGRDYEITMLKDNIAGTISIDCRSYPGDTGPWTVADWEKCRDMMMWGRSFCSNKISELKRAEERAKEEDKKKLETKYKSKE